MNYHSEKEELQKMRMYNRCEEWKYIHEMEKEFEAKKKQFVEKILKIKRQKRVFMESKLSNHESQDEPIEINIHSINVQPPEEENPELTNNSNQNICPNENKEEIDSQNPKMHTRSHFIRELIEKENLYMEGKHSNGRSNFRYRKRPDSSLQHDIMVSNDSNSNQFLSFSIKGKDFNSNLKQEMNQVLINSQRLSKIREKYRMQLSSRRETPSDGKEEESSKNSKKLPILNLKKTSHHKKANSLSTKITPKNFPELSLYERIMSEISVKAIPEKASIYKYYVGRGNNGNVVKCAFRLRPWWREAPHFLDEDINFLWTQVKKPSFYERIGNFADCEKDYNPKEARIHNHFPFNEEIGHKKNLFFNLKKICNANGIELSNIIPLTIFIEGEKGKEEFVQLFNHEKAIWIIKPGENTNRGRGIQVSGNLSEILKFMSDKKSTFIVQKYIETPLLYNKRKFDFRCYMLITSFSNELRAYFYNEGYVRTSSEEFTLNDFENPLIHLTNDAIQKKGKNYGKHEPSNKVSFAEFEKFVCQEFNASFRMEEVMKRMKDIMKLVVESVSNKLDPTPKKQIYELFGLDFMLDSDLQLKLIEINTNPCLETPCSLLQRIISNVLDNSFRLSIDVLFPPSEKYEKKAKELSTCKKENFELIFKNS